MDGGWLGFVRCSFEEEMEEYFAQVAGIPCDLRLSPETRPVGEDEVRRYETFQVVKLRNKFPSKRQVVQVSNKFLRYLTSYKVLDLRSGVHSSGNRAL